MASASALRPEMRSKPTPLVPSLPWNFPMAAAESMSAPKTRAGETVRRAGCSGIAWVSFSVTSQISPLPTLAAEFDSHSPSARSCG